MNKTLKTPHQWMAESGIRIPNVGVWRVDGRDEFTPIDFETFQNTTRTLTQMFGFERIPVTMGKELLIEQIETKIEEYKENIQAEINDVGRFFPEDHQYDQGAIAGLQLALNMIYEVAEQ